MPRKLTAYGCKYRCGAKVQTSRKRMERHEKTCKLNPERRACPTCAFEVKEYDDDLIFQYYCTEDHLPEGKRMVVDCDFWQPRIHPIRQDGE